MKHPTQKALEGWEEGAGREEVVDEREGEEEKVEHEGGDRG